MRKSALFGAKTSDFSKFILCPHGQGGWSQCGHFADKGKEGQCFVISCGCVLCIAPY